MSWARLDDRFHGNPKVLRVWNTEPAAVGLYVMGITYCAQHETDGRVHEWFVLSVAPLKRVRTKLAKALVDARMWTPADDGWDVPDYLDFNPSHADLEGKRERERERIRAHRTRQVGGKLPSTPQQAAAVLIDPDPSPPSNSTVAASGDAVTAVWDAYVETRTTVLGPRSAPTLTAARRRLITARLKEYEPADLIDAVKGWRHSPHNRGENDRGRPFCDLELLLRDAGHIETFRDMERSQSQPAGATVADLAVRINAAHESEAAA